MRKKGRGRRLHLSNRGRIETLRTRDGENDVRETGPCAMCKRAMRVERCESGR